MSKEIKQAIKTRLHKRNKNQQPYDLVALVKVEPKLGNYVKSNKHGNASVDFSSPVAVKLLNKALLNHYYGVQHWNFPDENLCPPIPGRADYIHNVADLLSGNNFGTIPTGNKVTCLDIGVGASCIYPIIGVIEYNWNFIGSDIDKRAIETARAIVAANAMLNGKIECRVQKESSLFFEGIILDNDKIDITICNPPFHSSVAEAQESSLRKVTNLTGERTTKPTLNFSGNANELMYKGGEYSFVHNMIKESTAFAKNCLWFTTLVSKQPNLRGIRKALEKRKATAIKTIPMGTGNKSSRIVAWTYHSKEEQKIWREMRWKR